MIKNRYVQLFVRSAIFVVMLFGAIMSLMSNPSWYVYYTNLSNYLCLLVVFLELICVIALMGKHKLEGNRDVHPLFKFCTLIIITVTFLVYNILLNPPTNADYWNNYLNVLLHFVNPILFWLDWLLFAEHRNTRWYYPFVELVLPLIYVAYILLCTKFFPNNFFYPYFFMNVNELGYKGVALWILALVGAFLLLGLIIFIFDNIKNWNEARKRKRENI